MEGYLETTVCLDSLKARALLHLGMMRLTGMAPISRGKRYRIPTTVSRYTAFRGKPSKLCLCATLGAKSLEKDKRSKSSWILRQA